MAGITCTLEDKLVASDGALGAIFGCSVSLDGDDALIGAYNDDSPNTAQGSASVS